MKGLILFATLVAFSASFDLHSLAAVEWNAYKAEFGKEYASIPEEQIHMSTFLDSKQKIAEHNLKYHKGEASFALGINEFSDMLPEERSSRVGLMQPEDKIRKGYQFLPPGDHIIIPKSIDWRTMGAVTPVKNQGNCGSCWAFAATGSLEGQHFRKTGKLVSLSEQELIDCIIPDYGCDGGRFEDAFKYIRKNGGLDTEASYPYIAKNGTCHFMKSSVGATVTGFVSIGHNENDLLKAVATVGPVSVAVFANDDEFFHYQSGVFDGWGCNQMGVDHGVLVVGYGSEKGNDYWIIKNSWGPKWGENGYMRMARGVDECSITTDPVYPLV